MIRLFLCFLVDGWMSPLLSIGVCVKTLFSFFFFLFFCICRDRPELLALHTAAAAAALFLPAAMEEQPASGWRWGVVGEPEWAAAAADGGSSSSQARGHRSLL